MKKIFALSLIMSLFITSGCSLDNNANNIDKNKDDSSTIVDDKNNNTLDEKDNMIRTIINYNEVSLPHHMSAEIKESYGFEEQMTMNVYPGHPKFAGQITIGDYVTGEQFMLTLEEFRNCSFSIVVNYNDEKSNVAVKNIDYSSEAYNITSSEVFEGEIYKGSVINYSKLHSFDLDIESMNSKSKGFVNIEMNITLLNGNMMVFSKETIYYSIAKDKIVFGLSQNPIAYPDDEGVYSYGWTYSQK